jgi:hypothetical protein
MRQVVEAERAVLFALNFDLLVDVPDAWVLPYLKGLGLQRARDGAGGDVVANLVASVGSILESRCGRRFRASGRWGFGAWGPCQEGRQRPRGYAVRARGPAMAACVRARARSCRAVGGRDLHSLAHVRRRRAPRMPPLRGSLRATRRHEAAPARLILALPPGPYPARTPPVPLPRPAPSLKQPETLMLTVTQRPEDVCKAALMTVCMVMELALPLPPGACYAEHVGTPTATLVGKGAVPAGRGGRRGGGGFSGGPLPLPACAHRVGRLGAPAAALARDTPGSLRLCMGRRAMGGC